ncbi:MAG: hypothetical protein ACI9KE_000411 [Polyangiales bacterium]|jgi:hypothetical protein
MILVLPSIAFMVEGDTRQRVIISLVLCAFVLPVLLFLLWRAHHKERWSLPLFDLETQFSGRYSTSLNDQVAWLNTYWADTYNPYWIIGMGRRFGTLRVDVGGYSMLLDVHPEKPHAHTRYANSYRPRLNVLVAAHILLQAQSSSRLTVDARVHFDTLQRMGFTLVFSTSGILAEGSPELIKRFAKRPEELHLLAQTLQSLANLAAHLGPPATPLS